MNPLTDTAFKRLNDELQRGGATVFPGATSFPGVNTQPSVFAEDPGLPKNLAPLETRRLRKDSNRYVIQRGVCDLREFTFGGEAMREPHEFTLRPNHVILAHCEIRWKREAHPFQTQNGANPVSHTLHYKTGRYEVTAADIIIRPDDDLPDDEVYPADQSFVFPNDEDPYPENEIQYFKLAATDSDGALQNVRKGTVLVGGRYTLNLK
jgi:hypothetical protein